MPQRRRKLRRSKNARLSRRALLLALGVIAIIAIVAVAIDRQYAGYFAHRGTKRYVAVAPTTAPSPAVTQLPAPPPSPSPLPSGASPPPRIAVIIDDCGYDLNEDLKFVALPFPLTLSILPLTPHGKEVAAAATQAGKFVMLHLPMEPESTSANPGPGAITTAMSDSQITSQVEADIAALPPMPGANNHMGSKATSDPRVMRDVLSVLKRDDMFFIDSMTAMTTVGSATAEQVGVPTAQRDVFLDDEKSVPYIVNQVHELEAVARKNGAAIAIGHPNPQTLEALEKTLPQLQAAGFSFVAASSLVH